VQRARIAARSQLPKLMLINTEENSEHVDLAMYDEALSAAGVALKSTSQAILFKMTVAESDLEEVYQVMGIRDPLGAKAHLLHPNAVHVVYFDPVSLLFGSQYYYIDEVNTTKKVTLRTIVQYTANTFSQFSSNHHTFSQFSRNHHTVHCQHLPSAL